MFCCYFRALSLVLRLAPTRLTVLWGAAQQLMSEPGGRRDRLLWEPRCREIRTGNGKLLGEPWHGCALRNGCPQERPDGQGPSELGPQGVWPYWGHWRRGRRLGGGHRGPVSWDRGKEQLPSSERRQLTTVRDAYHDTDDILLTSEARFYF